HPPVAVRLWLRAEGRHHVTPPVIIGAPGIISAKEQPANHQPAHSSGLPGIEDAWVIAHHVFQRLSDPHPRFQCHPVAFPHSANQNAYNSARCTQKRTRTVLPRSSDRSARCFHRSGTSIRSITAGMLSSREKP